MFEVYMITGNVGYLHQYETFNEAVGAANHARSRTNEHYMIIRASDKASVYCTM